MNKKPRIALLGDGVLGSGPLGEGIPVLHDLFTRLSQHYDFSYYSFRRIITGKIPTSLRTRQVVGFKIPGRIKYIFLMLNVILDHIRNPFSLIFCISDYPCGYIGIFLGKFFKIRCVVQLIAFEAVALENIGWGNLSHPKKQKITRAVCENASVLIMVAEYQKKIASIQLPTSRRIEVLPLRINPEEFIYRKRKISFPVELIQVGYYSSLKDQDCMLKAFERVSQEMDCRFTLVGAGFDPEFQEKLSKMGLREKVNLPGYVSQSDLKQYYVRAHILLHAAHFETGCAVIQEAMASGVAVCGTDVGLLADIGDRYAIIVPVADEKKMAEGILKLVRDPSLYEQITTDAFQWISRRDASWAAGNYKEFIDNLLNKVE